MAGTGAGESLLILGLKWVGIIPLALFLWKMIDSWFVVKNQTKKNAEDLTKLDKKLDAHFVWEEKHNAKRQEQYSTLDGKMDVVHDYIVGQKALDEQKRLNLRRRDSDK